MPQACGLGRGHVRRHLVLRQAPRALDDAPGLARRQVESVAGGHHPGTHQHPVDLAVAGVGEELGDLLLGTHRRRRTRISTGGMARNLSRR